MNTTAGTGIMKFNMTNVWDQFKNAVTATVIGSTTFEISRQEPDSDGYYVASYGEPTIANGVISMNIVVTDETDPNNISSDSCTITMQ